MKANKETTLFTVLTGSHLYGNAGSTSDFDYKAVCVPPLDDLLLNNKMVNRKEKPVGVGPGGKMEAGETETEYLPIQVFLDDFFNGQTYALEVAFAVAQNKPALSDRNMVVFNETLGLGDLVMVREMVEDLIDQFLTKSVKKMVGYAVSQSKLYGLKTDRYASLNKVSEIVKEVFMALCKLKASWEGVPGVDSAEFNTLLRKTRLNETPDLLEVLCKLDYVKMTTVMNARGGMSEAPALEICSKKYVLTSYWGTVLESVHATLAMYGTRVKQFEGQGVDWKALSH